MALLTACLCFPPSRESSGSASVVQRAKFPATHPWAWHCVTLCVAWQVLDIISFAVSILALRCARSPRLHRVTQDQPPLARSTVSVFVVSAARRSAVPWPSCTSTAGGGWRPRAAEPSLVGKSNDCQHGRGLFFFIRMHASSPRILSEHTQPCEREHHRHGIRVDRSAVPTAHAYPGTKNLLTMWAGAPRPRPTPRLAPRVRA